MPSPANLVATAISATSIDLSWDAYAGATGYSVERNGVVLVDDHATTSYSDTGLAAGTSYDYRVRAVLGAAVPAEPLVIESWSSFVSTATSTAFDISKPSGTAPGDLLLAFVVNDIDAGSSGEWSSPGWTEQFHLSLGAGRIANPTILSRIAGESEPSTYTFTPIITSDAREALILRISGQHVAWLDSITTPISQINIVSPTSVNITPNQGNCLVLQVMFNINSQFVTAADTIVGYEGQIHSSAPGSKAAGDLPSISVCYLTQTTAAATGTTAWWATNTDGGTPTLDSTRLALAIAPASNSHLMTGGTITEADGYVYHTFTTSGTLTLVGAGPVDVEYLVVAGGGGGASNGTGGGGGGGAGGLLTNAGGTVLTISATQTVTIGAGGVGGANLADLRDGTRGTDSSLGSLVVPTGGGAGDSQDSTTGVSSGGSGGGGAWTNQSVGTGIAGQGHNGGAGRVDPRSGGGGGGAGSAGSSAVNGSFAGSGRTVWGTTYAGGGNGGGNGLTVATSPANSGKGGDAGVSPSPGGSGIVIVRYPVGS
jgi:hypothetical protein